MGCACDQRSIRTAVDADGDQANVIYSFVLVRMLWLDFSRSGSVAEIPEKGSCPHTPVAGIHDVSRDIKQEWFDRKIGLRSLVGFNDHYLGFGDGLPGNVGGR